MTDFNLDLFLTYLATTYDVAKLDYSIYLPCCKETYKRIEYTAKCSTSNLVFLLLIGSYLHVLHEAVVTVKRGSRLAC